MFLGALDRETGNRVSPFEGIKGKEYLCCECKEKVVLCKGEKTRPYFRHKADTECNYYLSAGESQNHRDAKLMLKSILENNDITIYKILPCGCSYKKEIETEGLDIQLEWSFEWNGKKVADVACLKDGELVCIFEIFHTHKTREEDRPEPWYELSTESISKALETGKCFFKCIRDNFSTIDCSCEKIERCRECKVEISAGKIFCEECYYLGGVCYLYVPYSEKEKAKRAGAKWDPAVKMWYIGAIFLENDKETFRKWL